MQPFLAMIIPVGGGPSGPVDPGYGVGVPPSQIWGGRPGPGPGGGWVGNPPGIWGPTDPRPGWWVPGAPGAPGYQPGGGLGIWGGAGEPMPQPPIVIPPDAPGKPPLVIWGGGNVPMPMPPIELPGGGNPPTDPGQPPQRLVEWRTAWTPQTGWIVVGIPQGPHPAPSKA